MAVDGKPDGRRFNTPPEDTKFKKGQSGNPSGKPTPCPLNVDASLKTASRECVIAMNSNGKRIKMTKAEAAAHQLVNAALKGVIKAIRECLRLLRRLEAAGITTESITIVVENALPDALP